jgi:chemotaxis protein histidine kinase CheA
VTQEEAPLESQESDTASDEATGEGSPEDGGQGLAAAAGSPSEATDTDLEAPSEASSSDASDADSEVASEASSSDASDAESEAASSDSSDSSEASDDSDDDLSADAVDGDLPPSAESELDDEDALEEGEASQGPGDGDGDGSRAGELWTGNIGDRELWPHARREIKFSDLNLTVDYFKQAFIAAIESLQMTLVTVEQKTDPVSAIAETIPGFKTVLGAFSLLDLNTLTRLTADTISLVDYVSTEQVPHTTVITDILLQACSFLIQGLSSMRMSPDGNSWGLGPEWDREKFHELQENLWAARQGMLSVAPPPPIPTSSGASYASKPKKLGEILVEKGLISEGDLGGLIQAQKTARNVRLGEILIQEGFITEEELAEALRRQQNEDKGRRVGEILVSMGRLEHEHVDKALKVQDGLKETKLGEILLKQKIGAPEKVAAALREQKLSEGAAAATATGSHMVKVETHKLDGLIDLVGELVITQSLVTSNESVKQLKEQKFNKDLAQVSRITSELQRNAMSLRMVQINNTFRRMNRLVRDLAHKFEKDVEFVSVGEDTEIDRGMVEAIYDPLVHMIRNALDHGLESPKERAAMGKSPKGLVTLKAYHQGGNVVIELSDNGRGLDVDKVISKAEEKGLIQPGENLSLQQIHNLVFQPGFSTVDKITEISGRGVGMDVVRKSIEQLRGKVDFTSEPGEGSNFTIRLPLTLAIIDGMVVRVGDNRYILPTISINESFRPKPEEYFTVKNQGEMIKVRDNLLPLMRLDRIVNAEGAVRDPSEALVVVVENEGQRRCLLVDEVLGKQEVVIKSLGERLKYVRALAGGTILGDGRVGLILDINGLFDVGESSGSPMGIVSHEAAPGSHDDWDM